VVDANNIRTMITSFFAPKRSSRSKALVGDDATEEPNATFNTGKRTREAASGTTKTPLRVDDDIPAVTAGQKTHFNAAFAKRRRDETSGSMPTSSAPFSPQVQEMLSHLHDPVDANEHKTWKDLLSKHLSSGKFRALAHFVAAQRLRAPKNENGGRSGCIYPPSNEVFSALNMLPLHKVKVVIVGQDPYHQYNQGHGLAFSVKRGVKIPPSLRNIYKELIDDPEVPEFKRMPTHGNLQSWSENHGVILLNAVLTVRHGEANSHVKKGWEDFTDAVIDAVVQHYSDRGVVFLLWGKPASKKAEAVLQKHKLGQKNKSKHVVICSSHPSPLGATKTNSPFMKSRCFSRANKALREMGMDPVDWSLL
jgi:uracil-DNA glycosylase